MKKTQKARVREREGPKREGLLPLGCLGGSSNEHVSVSSLGPHCTVAPSHPLCHLFFPVSVPCQLARCKDLDEEPAQ